MLLLVTAVPSVCAWAGLQAAQARGLPSRPPHPLPQLPHPALHHDPAEDFQSPGAVQECAPAPDALSTWHRDSIAKSSLVACLSCCINLSACVVHSAVLAAHLALSPWPMHNPRPCMCMSDSGGRAEAMPVLAQCPVDPEDRELVNDEWRLPRARELAQLVRALSLRHPNPIRGMQGREFL